MKFCKYCKNQLKNNRRKVCGSCITSKRRWAMKLKLIEELGGKCVRCEFNKHPAALQFHHTGEKTFQISGNYLNKSYEFLKIELKKCILLCANCHSIEHSNGDRFIEDIKNQPVVTKEKKQNKCVCGKVITPYGNVKQCRECKDLSQWKILPPPKEILEELLKTHTQIEIAKIYNVNRNSIRRWIKKLQISPPARI